MAGPGMLSFPRTEKYSSLVAENGTRMRQDRVITDFQIFTGKESFPCHKYVLALHSLYLKAMLMSDMVEANRESISLDHIPPGTMEAILDYMYTGHISFHADSLMAMVYACDYLQMKEMMERCVEAALSILTPSNALSWMKLGTELTLTEISHKAKKMMVSNFKEISSQPEFLEMKYAEVVDNFSDVVRSDNDRDEVLQAGMRWVGHDADNRHAHLEDLLKLIQLEDCTLQAILVVMSTYGATIVKSNVLNVLSIAAKRKAVMKHQTVIVAGKVDGEVNRVCWSRNQDKQFVKLCEIPYDLVIDHSVCKTPKGFAVTGGRKSDMCFMFNAWTKEWVTLQKMLGVRSGHGSIYIKGRLYVIGKWNSGKGNKSVECLVLKEGQWQRGPDLSIAVKSPKLSDIDDRVYLLDAEDTNQLLMSVDSGVWTKLEPLPVKEACNGASMTSVNDQLVVAGGWARVCAWYNPATDTWAMGQKPSYCHFFGSLVCKHKTLLLVGGRYSAKNWGTNRIEEYNIVDGSWSASTIKLPKSICGHQAVVLDIMQED